MSQFNDRIRQLRKKKGLSQAELAERLGMKTSTYSQMERSGKILAQTILDIAAILEIDHEEIMNPENENLINTEQNNNDFAVLEQPHLNLDINEHKGITLTNREENAIIMLRNLKPADKEYIYSMLKELHDKKFKRG